MARFASLRWPALGRPRSHDSQARDIQVRPSAAPALPSELVTIGVMSRSRAAVISGPPRVLSQGQSVGVGLKPLGVSAARQSLDAQERSVKLLKLNQNGRPRSLRQSLPRSLRLLPAPAGPEISRPAIRRC